MRLIIAGSRNIFLRTELVQSLVLYFELDPVEIVCGGAAGVDESGKLFARKVDIPIRYFYADWDKYGKSAGPRRNAEMAEYADALLLIHSNTKGSLNMKYEMIKKNKPIFEVVMLKHKGLTK